jgi:hypothetical protein
VATFKNKQRQVSYLAATIIIIQKSQGFYGYSYCEVDVPLDKRYILKLIIKIDRVEDFMNDCWILTLENSSTGGIYIS